ncbi:MAG: carbon-nitrogen hydrolase family protein [Planctomycetota bacterium]|nr:carbon-nitrogen hydrolase family protein [Planctomycetota bacterium]
MTTLRIGLAQTRQTSDLATNAETILKYVDQAAAKRVQILCFPEAQTVGYRVDIATPDTPSPVEELRSLHAEVAARCARAGMACILGTEMPVPGDPTAKPHNSALVIDEGGNTVAVHHKTRLTPLDALAYTAGSSFETVELCGVRVGVVICFEGFRFAETTAECVGQGAQLIFHPQNNTTRPNDWKTPIHHAMLTTRAAENTVWFASCNACLDPHQNCRSMVIAPDGRVHAQTELKQEVLLVTDIDLRLATRAMFRFDLEDCAQVLFADTVQRAEFDTILPSEARGND